MTRTTARSMTSGEVPRHARSPCVLRCLRVVAAHDIVCNTSYLHIRSVLKSPMITREPTVRRKPTCQESSLRQRAAARYTPHCPCCRRRSMYSINAAFCSALTGCCRIVRSTSREASRKAPPRSAPCSTAAQRFPPPPIARPRPDTHAISDGVSSGAPRPPRPGRGIHGCGNQEYGCARRLVAPVAQSAPKSQRMRIFLNREHHRKQLEEIYPNLQ